MTSGPHQAVDAVNVVQSSRNIDNATGTSDRSPEFDQMGLSGQDIRFPTGLQLHG
jgi:hypothetical protein